LTEPQRAEVGRVLAQLGDPRPGVAPRNPPGKGEPFFAWSEEIAPVTFTMGGDPHAWGGGNAVQRTIRRPYRISLYPVTNAQYDQFEKSDYFKALGWVIRDKSNARVIAANQPVANVAWMQAAAFCCWINSLGLSALELGLRDAKKDEKWEVALPSEAEWEYAASGPEARWLPWSPPRTAGHRPPVPTAEHLQGRCNWRGSGLNTLTPVGMYDSGQSWCGAFDMLGNVWEWTRTGWEDVPRQEAKDASDLGHYGERRVLRGAGYVDDLSGFLRCACRRRILPWYPLYHLGFRVAVIRLA